MSTGEYALASFVLRVFIRFPKAGILGEILGEGLNKLFSSLPGISFDS